ncbi:amidohydrolase family protein [Paraburkholderia sediminicola]|uniref:hypothetical protein n=1 Tax=Paraburkholderia sediminicola TaxID=458836 RepID=UPI0038B8BCC7
MTISMIEHLLHTFGDTQLMIGSDYPFLIMDAEASTRPGKLQHSNEVLQRLIEGNARRWLGETFSSATADGNQT